MDKRKELFDWVKTHHYKPGLVDVTYEVVDTLDCWTMVFDTGDTVFVYGYSNGRFTLRFNDPATFDGQDRYFLDYNNLVHRIKGIISDGFWYGLTR